MYFFLRPVRPGGIIEVPQISRIYTDFFFHYTLSADETYSVGLRRFSRLHCSPLRKRFVLKSSFNSLYDPFGSPCRGQKPSLPLKKAPPLTPPSLLRSEGENRPTRCSNRYAIRLADHQRSRQILRDGTARGGMGIGEAIVCRLAEDFMAIAERRITISINQ